MQLKNDVISFLVGNNEMEFRCKTLTTFSPLVCEFLNSLSVELLADKEARKYSDIVSFAFWCRKSNFEKLKDEYDEKVIRLGRGLAFHITPSNVPVNFAFSYAFSLLAGNGNIVRVPSNDFIQIDIICGAINNLFKDIKFKSIADMTAFIRYDHNDEITSMISEQCAARIIWGGNNTINSIRKFHIPERSVEIAFADRYSFCVIDAESINKIDTDTLKKIANGFYNDSYLMDQNACSSPNLVIWVGDEKRIKEAKEKFWACLYAIVTEKYDLQPVYAIDKYTKLCQESIEINSIDGCTRYGNYIYCVNFRDLPYNVDKFRGKCGYFYEYDTTDINMAAHIVNTRYQTLTYYGLDKSILVDFIVSNSLNGIDRIVPIGSALDISVIWDGYDLIRTLSRIVEVK